jgi:hypothetical protein
MNEMKKENELLEKALYNLNQVLKDSIHPRLNIMLKEILIELKCKLQKHNYEQERNTKINKN